MSKKDKKRKRRKLSKLLKSLPKVKIRIPIAPPGYSHKTKKDYDRRQNKKAVEREMDGN